jgi:hypothetical protein
MCGEGADADALPNTQRPWQTLRLLTVIDGLSALKIESKVPSIDERNLERFEHPLGFCPGPRHVATTLRQASGCRHGDRGFRHGNILTSNCVQVSSLSFAGRTRTRGRLKEIDFERLSSVYPVRGNKCTNFCKTDYFMVEARLNLGGIRS